MAYPVSENCNTSVYNQPISLQLSSTSGIVSEVQCASFKLAANSKLGAVLENVYSMQQTRSAVGDFVISVRIYNKMII